ncbi:MAG: alcohol dehydrogenase catalytic domain-containing protein, partial [Clostridia bacterium]|nr:alcohol dehydrogenase catalytic domain-containing protein [Clostridia bacterium]
MTLPKTMRAARLHAVGGPLRVEEVPVPEPGPGEVVVRVEACAVAPSHEAVVAGQLPFVLPPLPAVLGADAAGVVAAVGEGVDAGLVGRRVYTNPGVSCGACRACAAGEPWFCPSYALAGLFGVSQASRPLLERYQGGYAAYRRVPAANAVPVPEGVSPEHASLLGYVGTAYHGLRRAQLRAGETVLVNGATGTLGVGAVLSALAMGAARIVALARNASRLEEVAALAPRRIGTVVVQDGESEASLRAKVANAAGPEGPEVLIDCLPYVGSELTQRLVTLVRRGGRAVLAGGVTGALTFPYGHFLATGLMLTGTFWFSSAEAREMLALAASGAMPLDRVQVRAFPLEAVEEAV